MSTELHPPLARRPAVSGHVSRPVAGAGPYRLALRRLRRDRTALAFGAQFLVIVAMCLAAPLYARDVAHTGPADNHVTDTVKVGGQTRDVVSPSGIPIGPIWRGPLPGER
jgi:peptide/nickel transport system permease protein